MENNICYELKIFIDAHYKDLACGLLVENGIENFVEGSFSCDVEAEYNPENPQRDFYSELAGNEPIVIYSEDRAFLQEAQRTLSYAFAHSGIPVGKETFVLEKSADQNWRESWKASFQPILMEEICILPPWENPGAFPQQHKIVIDPGMAFGTGQHETTKLCLQALLTIPQGKKRLFDVGTGSGILAIAAKKLGFERIFCNDLDPDCLRVAGENFVVNNTEDISITNNSLEKISEKNFDVILANIQAKPLLKILGAIAERLSEDGIAVLSGILIAEREDFVAHLKEHNLALIKSEEMKDWCSLLCKKM